MSVGQVVNRDVVVSGLRQNMIESLQILSALAAEAETAAQTAPAEFRDAYDRAALVWRGLAEARAATLEELAQEAQAERERYLGG